ncbi:MAG: hypothetical protein K6G87_18870 [Butyrivibrio sp.]|uniref:hypothetical protein n=1 Tax=Butyrivibrio sp. TaxID=28121 RepID=UPI0025F7BF33|nr:hypothetical protein [Butyrivibrio sp.]MCR5773288.1 hypothetical protein [Butyrivibrio sp.]
MRRKIATMVIAGACSTSLAFGCMGITSYAKTGKGSSDNKKTQTEESSEDEEDETEDSKSSSESDSKSSSESDSKSSSKSKSKSGSSSSKSSTTDYDDAEDVLEEAFETIYDSQCIGMSGTCTVIYDDDEEGVLPSYVLADDDIYMEILTYEDEDEAAYLIIAYPGDEGWTRYIIPAGGTEDTINIDEYDFKDAEESGYSVAVGDLTLYSSADWEEDSEGETIEAEIEDYDSSYTADIDKDSRIERFETSFGSEYEIYYDEEVSHIVTEFADLLSEMEPDEEGYIESFRDGLDSSDISEEANDEEDEDDDEDVEVEAEELGTYVDTPVYWLDDLYSNLDEDDYSYDYIVEALEALDDAIDNELSFYDSEAFGKFSTGYDDNCYTKVKKGKTSSYYVLFYIPETDSYGQVEVYVENTSKSTQSAIYCTITGYSICEE